MESFDLLSLLVIVLRVFGVIAVVLTIIFVHEFGHYIVGRWCGIGASAFSLGFGPELLGYTDKRGTRWRLALIPLGGYVKFVGDGDAASMPSSRADEAQMASNAFPAAGPWKRAATVFAGPLFNGIFTVVVYSVFFFAFGKQMIAPVVGELVPNMPAIEAGLKPGDRFVTMDGVKVDSFDDLRAYVSLHSNDPIHFVIERQGQTLDVTIAPVRKEQDDGLGNQVRMGQIGFRPPLDPQNPQRLDPQYYTHVRFGVFKAVEEGVNQSAFIVSQTFYVLKRLVQGREDRCQLSGPEKVGQRAWQISELGFLSMVNFAAFLSLSIGLVNLFPIPPLDGGHLVFYVIEGVIRRPVPQRIQEIVFKIGLFFVLGFMVFAILNDRIPC